MKDFWILVLILIGIGLFVIILSDKHEVKINKPKYKYTIGSSNMNSVVIIGDTLIINNADKISSMGSETYINLDTCTLITIKLIK